MVIPFQHWNCQFFSNSKSEVMTIIGKDWHTNTIRDFNQFSIHYNAVIPNRSQ